MDANPRNRDTDCETEQAHLDAMKLDIQSQNDGLFYTVAGNLMAVVDHGQGCNEMHGGFAFGASNDETVFSRSTVKCEAQWQPICEIFRKEATALRTSLREGLMMLGFGDKRVNRASHQCLR